MTATACRWYALCDNPTEFVIPHPILGPGPLLLHPLRGPTRHDRPVGPTPPGGQGKEAMIITVTEDSTFVDGGSVWTITGVDDIDRPVTFGADWRMARDLADQVASEGSVDCEVEAWQILASPTDPRGS